VTKRLAARAKLLRQLKSVQLRYLRTLRTLIKHCRDVVDARLLHLLRWRFDPHPQLHARAVRKDAVEDTVRGALASLRSQLELGLDTGPFQDLLEKYGGDVSAAQSDELSAVLGIPIEDLGPIGLKTDVRATVDDWVGENVSLIKSIPAEYLDDVEGIVSEAYASGARYEDIAAELAERYGIAEGRAELIATDQINKLTATMNAERQKALGIDEFWWRVVKGCDVCDEFDNKKFGWDDPPLGGPGLAHIRCECYADPVTDESE
jgi:SPP1 gp7 family putative phage head morphogenesis protein